MGRLPRFARVAAITSALALGPGQTALAAPGQTLRPAAAVNGHVATESSQVLPKWTPSASLLTTYGRNLGGATPGRLAVDSRLQSHALVAFGIAGRAQLDVALPMTIAQRGTGFEDGRFVSLRPAALGDTRLGAKGTILRTPRKGLGLGVMFDATVPSGSDAALTSFGGPTYTPMLLGEVRIVRGVTFAVNTGYAVRPEVNVDGHIGGDAILYRGAVRVPVAPREQFAMFAELDGSASMVRGGGAPLAGRGGFRWNTRNGLVMNLWAGGAIVASLGLPTVRMGLSVGFAPVRRTRTERAFEGNERKGAVALVRTYDRALVALEDAPPPVIFNPKDPDGDGILASADLCPAVAEDHDGMQDADGCPELDDDRDGLRDAVDLCPRAPEIINGYRDDDGCPDRRLAEGGETFETFDERRILPALHFADGSSSVDEALGESLDELAELLRLNPWIERLQLAVYVPQTEDAPGDRALALARGAAIRTELQARGVAGWRVQSLPAKTVPGGTPARVRLSLSGRAGALDPVAPRPETLDRLIADAVKDVTSARSGPVVMEAQGPDAAPSQPPKKSRGPAKPPAPKKRRRSGKRPPPPAAVAPTGPAAPSIPKTAAPAAAKPGQPLAPR